MKKIQVMRVVSLIIAAIFVFSLAACGTAQPAASTEAAKAADTTKAADNTQAAAKAVSMKLWDFHPNAEKDFWSSLPGLYKKDHPNVDIVYETVPQQDYFTKMTTAFAANEAPDIFFMSPTDFLKYGNSGMAMDLTSYFKDDIKNDFLPASLDAVTINGKIYAVPFEIEDVGLYYNKEMLKAANVEVPKTWKDLVAATKKLTTDKVAGIMVEPSKGGYQNFTWYPFLWQTGSDSYDKASKKGTFEGAGVESALQLWGDLVKAGAPSKIAKGTWEPLIGEGACAMQVSGTWLIARIETEFPAMKDKIGVTPLPIPDGGKPTTVAGGWKLMANAKSKNADEAAKFIMWAMAGDTSLPLKWCTEVKFAFSPRTSVIKAGDAIFGKEGLRKQFRDDIYKTSIPEPRYPAEVVDAIANAIQDVMFNNVSAKDAAKKANDIINKTLATYDGSL